MNCLNLLLSFIPLSQNSLNLLLRLHKILYNLHAFLVMFCIFDKPIVESLSLKIHISLNINLNCLLCLTIFETASNIHLLDCIEYLCPLEFYFYNNHKLYQIAHNLLLHILQIGFLFYNLFTFILTSSLGDTV